jgi:hypothetical protein
MHFLVIDDRFRVPVFVFLELDPGRSAADPARAARPVTLELAYPGLERPPHAFGPAVRAGGAIGLDPEHPDRFREFPSDGHVRAAGFALIEPRYVGPSWETYVSVFRPEGEGRTKAPPPRRHPDRPTLRSAVRPERT